jgi:hypothetical protein
VPVVLSRLLWPNVTIAKFEDRAFIVVLTPIERSRRHKFLRRSGRGPSNWIHLASSIAIDQPNARAFQKRSFSLAIRADKEIKTGLELERQTFEAAKIPKL